MTGKQLKNSILQWAIQGKLVPQDPNDEPASVLLERIREEKARLIKEKKIKKDKNESIIYRGDDNSHYEKILATGEVKCIDDEIPFEIPKSWEWCRIKNIFFTTSGGTPKKGHPEYYINGTIPWVKSGELCDKYLYSAENLITEDGLQNSSAKYFPIDTVAVAMYGATIGKTSIFKSTLTTNQAICGIFPNRYIIPEYLYYFIQAKTPDYLSIAFGSGQPNISQDKIKETLFPVPPMIEQERIVKSLDILIKQVTIYDETQIKLKQLNNDIYTKIRKSILQEAIQGRLVPQIDSEESATVLLEKIKEEKSRLVKEGKLKQKDLTDSTIFKGDDNKYYEQIGGKAIELDIDFEFPNTWSVVRLSDICRLIDGEKKQGQYVCLDAKYLRGKSTGDKLNNGKFVSNGDIIILVDGENSGEVFTVPCDGYMGSTFKQLWVSREMYLPYVLYFIQFYKDRLRNSKKGAAIPHLNKDIFYNLLIGIPPCEEQIRISKKIYNLYRSL